MPPPNPQFQVNDLVTFTGPNQKIGRVIGLWQDEASVWRYLVSAREAPEATIEVWMLGTEITARP